MPAARTTFKIQQTETEIAVLQVKVDNIEEKVGEIKDDLKEVVTSMKQNTEDTHKLLKEMKESSTNAHKAMDTKIGALEKWRWMLMGAGIVLGSMGSHTLANLLK